MLVVGLMGICEDEFVQCFILVNQYREFCALTVCKEIMQMHQRSYMSFLEAVSGNASFVTSFETSKISCWPVSSGKL